MNSIVELLEHVCRALEEKKITYMLSGSLAMSTYTVSRMTRDIDIVVNLKVSDVPSLVDIFKDGFYIYEEGLKEEIRNKRMFNVIDLKSGLKIIS